MRIVNREAQDKLPVVKYYKDDRQLPELKHKLKCYKISESVEYEILGTPVQTERIQCIIVQGDKRLRNVVVNALNKYYAKSNDNNLRRDFLGVKNTPRTNDLRQSKTKPARRKSNSHKS